MKLPSNLKAGFVALAGVIVIGTIGFLFITGLSIGDAAYVTVITITTLGFGNPIGDLTPATKLWIVIVLLSGMGAAIYTGTAVMEYGFSIVIGSDHRRQRRMLKVISKVTNHVIVCGYGRVGSTAAAAIKRQGVPVVVIEDDDDGIQQAIADGFLVLEGDATRNEILLEARIREARSLVACVASSSDNLVITLSAHALHKEIPVFARAIDKQTEKKLKLAGARGVVTPELVGGLRIAEYATHPGLGEFVDSLLRDPSSEFQVRRFVVDPDSAVIGRSLTDLDLRRQGGAMIVSTTRTNQPAHTHPDPTRPFIADDAVYAIGSEIQLDQLARLLESHT
ncbi:MAG: potassium channel protein [Actinomycetota bacterium]